MKKTSLAALTAALTLLGLSASSAAAARSCALPVFGPGPAYHPQITPRGFSASVTNPFFPLKPGRTIVYTGTKDEKNALDLFVPTSRTSVIDGVRTRVVEDRLYLNNVLEERTIAYYAQDRCGNVWYFGEDRPRSTPRGTSSAPKAPSTPAWAERSPACSCRPSHRSAGSSAKSGPRAMPRTRLGSSACRTR